MAWKDISASTYKKIYNSGKSATSAANGNVWVTLQYDDASETPTSVKLRFKLSSKDSGNYWDMFYILMNPTDSSKRKLYPLKTVYTNTTSDSFPYTSSSFTVSKTYSAAKFTIPAYWICDDGNNNTSDTATDFYNQYKDSAWRGQNCRTAVSSTSLAVLADNTVATDVKAGTCSITDNGDNTFTLKGTKGASGTNNTASGPTLSWGYSNSYGTTFTNGQKETLKIADSSKASRKVYAKSVTGATYGDDKTAKDELAIKQYVAPSKPSGISITYTKSRMTIKENWTLKWTGGTKTNDSSAVAGYRIRIYKDGKTIQFKNSKGEVLTSGSSSDYYYDRDDTSTTMNINTSTNGFAPGDKVQVSICTYTKNGKGTRLCSGAATSSEYTVQNAGVANVKVSGAWKEGKIWVKVSGAWKEAEVAKAKVSGAWKESQ